MFRYCSTPQFANNNRHTHPAFPASKWNVAILNVRSLLAPNSALIVLSLVRIKPRLRTLTTVPKTTEGYREHTLCKQTCELTNTFTFRKNFGGLICISAWWPHVVSCHSAASPWRHALTRNHFQKGLRQWRVFFYGFFLRRWRESRAVHMVAYIQVNHSEQKKVIGGVLLSVIFTKANYEDE